MSAKGCLGETQRHPRTLPSGLRQRGALGCGCAGLTCMAGTNMRKEAQLRFLCDPKVGLV